MITKTSKTYSVKEVSKMLNYSRQRISQLINGFRQTQTHNGKKYQYDRQALLKYGIHYTYDKVNIRITSEGLKLLKKHKKEFNY